MFAGGQAPPAIVVYVDAWTAYGGSQFVDSPGTGRYHSYLCDEVVPWVDGRYRTLAGAGHRAIMGKSSGGFGAMITPMLRPDLFGALATHAGDSLYELCYMPEFGKDVRHLREYDGDIWRWWADFRSRTSFTREADMDLLGLLGVAACFSAERGRHRRAAVRPAHRGAAAAGVAALAGLGPGPDGAALRRRAAVAARRSGSTPGPGTNGSSTSGAEAFRAALREAGRARRGDPLRAVRGQPHGDRLPLPALARLALPAHRALSVAAPDPSALRPGPV